MCQMMFKIDIVSQIPYLSLNIEGDSQWYMNYIVNIQLVEMRETEF